jgi:hypothetical protein
MSFGSRPIGIISGPSILPPIPACRSYMARMLLYRCFTST